MEQKKESLDEIAHRLREEVQHGSKPSRVEEKVRDLLRRFAYERRGSFIVSHIRNKMEELELCTVPDFEYENIDGLVAIALESEEPEGVTPAVVPADATVRIGTLSAAKASPTSVTPDEALQAATSIMLMKDYSQLPVMVNSREVKGVITWKSIGSRLSLGGECELVRQCMEAPQVVGSDTPLLDAIGDISMHGYVLVKDKYNDITGIVTASDIGDQFTQLASPFLIIGEIEAHLRRIVYRQFKLEELKASSNEEGGRPIRGPADLTLGNYCRLLEKPDHWSRLNLHVDRKAFIKQLKEAGRIRNEVMHFNPEGLEPKDTTILQDVVRLLRAIARIGTHRVPD